MHKIDPNGLINNDENIMLIRYITSKNEANHTHGFIELEYIWSGCGYQIINGESCYVERGDLLFFNFGDCHTIKPSTKMEITNCLLNPEFVSEELMNSENALDMLKLSLFKDFSRRPIENILPRIRFVGKELNDLENHLESMNKEFDSKLSGYKTVLKSYVNILMTKIFRTFGCTDTINIYNEVSKIAPEVLKFIEENYRKKLSLNQLAKIGYYNPSYFSKIFKECFGKSVTEYVNIKRIAASMKLLEETNYKIESVSYQVGFNDKKRFYNLFKEQLAVTPDRYRKQNKKNMTII